MTKELDITHDKRNILILFAGIGGMSRDWQDHNITYIELDKEIYQVGKKLFPKQTWINDDVINYIENNDLSHFDIIFSTPSCTTHSVMNRYNKIKKVPDYTTLFGVRSFMMYHYSSIPFVIENTTSMYSLKEFPKPIKIGRHFIWSNRTITPIEKEITDLKTLSKNQLLRKYGLPMLDLPGDRLRKRQIVRNILEPDIANHLLNCIISEKQTLEAWL